MLTATSEQRPPVNNGQPKPGQIKFNSNFDWNPFKKRPPMYNDHYFGGPRVAVIDRFDCILFHLYIMVLACGRAGATFDWTFFDNSKLINFDD